MPKELTHWLVAQATAKRLADTPWQASLTACPNMLRIGSVAHDALYYLPASAPAPCRRVPYVLSGHEGEDPHEILRLLARDHAAHPRPWLAAWLAGLATHIAADTTFHPLVFWATGDYHHPDPRRRTRAVQRHRAFEALMDIHFMGGIGRVLPMSLSRTLRGAETPRETLFAEGRLTDTTGVEAGLARECQARAWRIFAVMQALARTTWLSSGLYAARGLLPSGVRELLALHYIPAMTAQLPRLAGEIDYRHPVTGEERRESLDALFERAVQRAAELLLALAPAVFEGKEPDLAPGLPLDGGTAGALTHFADPPLIRF